MGESMDSNEETVLHTEPSFAIYSTVDKFEETGRGEDLIKEKSMKDEGKLERSATVGESIEAEFSFGRNLMGMIKEDDQDDEQVDDEKERASNLFKHLKIDIQGESSSHPIHFPTGVSGVEATTDGNGAEFGQSDYDHNNDLEEFYNKMIHEDPPNPLVLRSYAQYLESKRDYSGAEECYSQAVLADPEDGKTLCQYAKMAWEVHGDQAKASNYFERAVRAAPEDSNVLAAYASFLWKIDEAEEEEESSPISQVHKSAILVDPPTTDFKEAERPSSPPLHLAMGLGIDMAGFGSDNREVHSTSAITDSDESTAAEEHYRRMIEEDPCNPLLLRNYAKFLHESKGDLRGAEEHYSRATLADPSDGQTCSLYAGLVWQLHRDRDRALAYFERAVQATPEDSNVLAAHARFLWETEAEDDDDDNIIEEAHNLVRAG